MRDDDETEFRGSGTPVPLSEEDQRRLDQAVAMERTTHADESEEALTQRLFKENSARVAMSLVDIALRGASERIRLDAGKNVIDRVLGPVGKETYRADSPLDAMVRQMQLDAEAEANKGA
jgi:hypothetical protein